MAFFCTLADVYGVGRTDAGNRENDEDWVLQPIQKGGSVKTFYKHIERG